MAVVYFKTLFVNTDFGKFLLVGFTYFHRPKPFTHKLKSEVIVLLSYRQYDI